MYARQSRGTGLTFCQHSHATGYRLPVQPIFEHRLELVGPHHARARARRRRAGNRPAARLGRLGRHVAAAAGRARRARAGARSPSTCRASGEATRLAKGALLPQLDAFAAELVETWADGRPGRRRRRPRSAAASRCGWPSTAASCRSPASSRSRPTGSSMPGWFDVDRARPDRPRAAVGADAGSARRCVRERPALSLPGDAQRASSTRSPHGETRADVAALLSPAASCPSSDAPFDLVGIRLPGAARVGRARPPAPAHRRADRARPAADHARRADRGLRHAARSWRPPIACWSCCCRSRRRRSDVGVRLR